TSCAANSAYNYNNSNPSDVDVQRFDLPTSLGMSDLGARVIIQVEQNAGGGSVLVNPDTNYFLYETTKNTTDIEMSGDPTYVDGWYEFVWNGRNGWQVCCYHDAVTAGGG
ncbi:MAG: hypothetical protein KDB07_13345, partial [Planctomycetes bacterium]|nr:hypothetical protein [Planctomycetota bacterium]